jgi:hypothetical protein
VDAKVDRLLLLNLDLVLESAADLIAVHGLVGILNELAFDSDFRVVTHFANVKKFEVADEVLETHPKRAIIFVEYWLNLRNDLLCP